MFTGLVTETGAVASLAPRTGGGATLTVKAGAVAQGAEIGDSISISGACLTVTSTGGGGGELGFELSGETLKSTTLGALKPGDRVNLEPSLRADQKLGGHFVTGHVDAVGKIRSKRRDGNAEVFEIEAPPAVTGFLVEKGSVALDGISLTVVDVLKDGFTVVIIPHTADVTTIGAKGPGDPVNLEADILSKYVARFLMRAKESGGAKGAGDDASFMASLIKGGFASEEK